VKNKRIVLYHCIAWALFIIYEVSGVYFITRRPTAFLDYFVHYSINIGLFYINTLIVFPNSVRNDKFKFYLAIPFIILELAGYVCVGLFSNWVLDALHIKITWSMQTPGVLAVVALSRAIYILTLSTAYWFTVHYYKSLQKNIALFREQMASQKKQLSLEKEIIRSENAYLQAQVNPHLLFNTLNFIYNSVEEVSEPAAEAVMLLSDISRYSMKNPDEDGLVFLTDEMDQINNLIRLNQIRFNSRLYIDYQATGDFEGLRIAPLILLSLVENVFKHADCSDRSAPAVINLLFKDDNLIFEIRNRKLKSARISHGIGVTNTKMRLDTRYGGKYVLDISDEPDYYLLDLKLKLDYAELLYS